MVLGKGTRAVMKEVMDLYDQLQERMETLDKCVKADTDGDYVTCSISDNMKYIQFVKLISHGKLSDITEVADEGSIEVDWEEDGRTCYSFTVEGVTCKTIIKGGRQ